MGKGYGSLGVIFPRSTNPRDSTETAKGREGTPKPSRRREKVSAGINPLVCKREIRLEFASNTVYIGHRKKLDKERKEKRAE
jgi:hypothetical protein